MSQLMAMLKHKNAKIPLQLSDDESEAGAEKEDGEGEDGADKQES